MAWGDLNTKFKCFCNSCQQETNHLVIYIKVVEGSNALGDGYEAEWTCTYRMLECCGCDNVSMRVDPWYSEFDVTSDIEYFPPRIARKMPRWSWALPGEWSNLLQEVYRALGADCSRLAMMGARTILDVYMNDTVGDIGGFEKKLNALESHGHLAKADCSVLKAALEVGHAAAHRGHSPSTGVVFQVMDIVENLLHRHVLSKEAKSLIAATPPRPGK